MRAAAIQQFGPAQGLALIDVPAPQPGPGEVVIANEAIGVGGVDAVIRRGAIAGYGFETGHVLGSEVAGTVVGVGDGVDASWTGRHVWATTGAAGGGYAERTVARAETLLELPATLAAADAVTVGSSALVAHFALRHAHFDAGESVLIRGAAGGIGVMAVQLAAAAGAGTIAVTTSSPQRGERLRALGATHVLDRDGGGTDGPGDYDVVLDIVAGPRAPAFLGRLGRAGRMVFVGIVGGPPADLTGGLFAAFQRSLSVATFSLDVVDVAEQRAYARDVLAAAARGELRAAVHDVLALDRVAEAHQLMDDGAVFGRLVLVPEVA